MFSILILGFRSFASFALGGPCDYISTTSMVRMQVLLTSGIKPFRRVLLFQLLLLLLLPLLLGTRRGKTPNAIRMCLRP